MWQGTQLLHYLGLKSTYDGCWGAKAPIIAIQFDLKSTFDSPERTYHDAMSCSTWVELPGIGSRNWGTYKSIHHDDPGTLVVWSSSWVVSVEMISPLFALSVWGNVQRPPSTFVAVLAPLHFSLNIEIEKADSWTWRQFNDNDDMTTTTMPF